MVGPGFPVFAASLESSSGSRVKDDGNIGDSTATDGNHT